MERKISLVLADDGVTMEIRAGDVDHGSGMVVRLVSRAERKCTGAAEQIRTT